MSPEHSQKSLATTYKESTEITEQPGPTFLAGMFEASGQVSFQIETRKQKLANGAVIEYTYSRPIISYTDTRRGKIALLANMFGGNLRNVKDFNSFRWLLRGQAAVAIALSLRGQAPARKAIIEDIADWQNAETGDERNMIAELAKSRGNIDLLLTEPEDYRTLIQNPQFMAGVVEARGLIEQQAGRLDGMHINSMNIGLLDAIRGEYGGGIIMDPVVRSLVISQNNANRLLSEVNPYLLRYNE